MSDREIGGRTTIREYHESDRTALVKLLEQLMDYVVSIDDLKRLRRMPEWGRSYTRRTLRKVTKNNGIIYVAEVNGRLVGAVAGTILEQTKEDQLEHIPSKFGEVQEFVVEAGYRNKGIGTMLMNRLEKYFKENNCNISGVGAIAPNIVAHRLYSKLGYEDRSIYMTKNL